MNYRGRLVVLTLALGVNFGSWSSAQAAEGIIDFRAAQESVELKLSSGAPLDVTAKARSVTATLDGQPAAVSFVPLTASAEQPPRRAVLLVDVSGSMEGARITQAKAAATQFVAALPADVLVGLVTFSSAVDVIAEPTRDREPVLRGLRDLRAAGNTSLYDGLQASLDALGSEGDRFVLLLSDGADTTSTSALPQAVSRLQGSAVRLNAISLGGASAGSQPLNELATAGGGRVAETSDAALPEAFRAAAARFDEQFLVRVEVPQSLAGRSVTVGVAVDLGSRVIRDEAVVLLPGTASTLPSSSEERRPAATPWWGSKRALVLGCGTAFLGLLLALLLLLRQGGSNAEGARRSRRLLQRYTLLGAAGDRDDGATEKSPVQAAVALADRLGNWRGHGGKLDLRLDRAGYAFRSSEWLAGQVALGLFSTVVIGVTVGAVPGLLCGFLIGGLLPSYWLRVRTTRRQEAFNDGLPDGLQLVVGGLSTGYSLAQALDAVVRQGAQPLAGEVGRALAESRLGIPVEDTLENVATRMESEEFRWVVMAVRVQREVGGNLAEVLQTVFETMRERSRIRGQVRSLSAEGRLSAWVLIGLPIFMALYQFLFRRDYMRPLYTEPVGQLMLGITVLMVITGAALVKKLVKIEI